MYTYMKNGMATNWEVKVSTIVRWKTTEPLRKTEGVRVSTLRLCLSSQVILLFELSQVFWVL